MDVASSYWIHDLSPFVLGLHWGDLGIRWYGVAYLTGLLWGYWMIKRWALRGRAPFQVHEIGDLILAAGLGMIIGGRLGYVLLYEPHLLWEFDRSIPWWGLLAVNHGGMASHGGLVGMALGTWWYCRKNKRSLPVVCDLIAATAPVGICCGRIANFINGELYGRPSTVPWAVIFPQAHDGVPRHPSQLYAAVLEGLLPLLIIIPFHARHRRPGLTVGLMIMLYACGRFVDEYFRLPDMGQPGGPAFMGQEPVPAIWGYLSKGQFYTLPLFAIGAVVMLWAMRRPAQLQAYVPPVTPAQKTTAHS